MSKIKGSNAERDLIKKLWNAGWAAIRSAGSGSMHYPSPDILASNKLRKVAIEAKATKESKKYFSDEDIKQLMDFCSYFGAEPWIAIKFDREEWVFLNPEDLKKTQSGYVFSKEDLCSGLSFDEVITGFTS